MDKIRLLDEAKYFANERLNAYFEYENYYCATDARLLIMVPKDQITSDIAISDNPPNFSFILRDQDTSTQPVLIKLGTMVDKLNGVPMIDEFDDCEQCDGDGKVECDCCGNLADCEECDGTGEGRSTGNQELDYEYHLKISLSHINVTVANRFINALKEVGYTDEDELKLITTSDTIPAVFEIDGIKIICSVSHYSSIDEEKVIKVL
jgi:hypothetical protein